MFSQADSVFFENQVVVKVGMGWAALGWATSGWGGTVALGRLGCVGVGQLRWGVWALAKVVGCGKVRLEGRCLIRPSILMQTAILFEECAVSRPYFDIDHPKASSTLGDHKASETLFVSTGLAAWLIANPNPSGDT